MRDFGFTEAAQFLGAAIKDNHTVVEKWPFRLKLRPGQPGAQEEFDRVLAGGVRKGAIRGVAENCDV